MGGIDRQKRQVRRLQRYFINEKICAAANIITGDDARHMSRVMRMKPGDEIVCCDPDGRCARCSIDEITTERVTVSVVAWLTHSAELPVYVTIAQGLPKGDKLDLVVQKGTELGAFAFLPFSGARSIVKWNGNKRERKTARLRKIAKEAAEQSHRNRIPDVRLPITFEELLREAHHYDVKIVAYEEDAKSQNGQTIAPLLTSLSANDSVLAVFGPEGGLTEDEADALKDVGFTSCGLGPRILRTETASLYVLSAISYQMEG